MSDPEVLPEIKQIIGAMIFAASRPLTVSEMRKCLVEVAKEGGIGGAFAGVKDKHVREALAELEKDLSEQHKTGFVLSEVAGGYRYQSDQNCGVWLKHLLEIGRPNRLSKPALETLAIIAYRQPATRVEIEGVRGVNVDHIMKSLLEYRLIKIAGRSELPGRPFLYGTTQLFLEHFGLKSLKDLHEMEPMLLLAREGTGKKGTQELPLDLEQVKERAKDGFDQSAEEAAIEEAARSKVQVPADDEDPGDEEVFEDEADDEEDE